MSGSGVSGSGVSGSGLSASGAVSASGVSGSGLSGSGLSASGVSGSGLSASGAVSASGVSGSGLSTSGVSASGMSASGASASGASASGVSGSGVSGNGLSASGVSASGVSASGVSASGVSASGVSASGSGPGSGSGSGSGSVCPDIQFQIFGPLCVTAMQVQLCSFNFSSETCDMCNTLLSLCGPFEGNTSTLCASEMAINCSQTSRTCFSVQTVAPTNCDFCAFVGSVCFQGREFELCPVEGLVDGCISVLNRSPFVCECFLPSFQCMFCRTLLDVCTATIPVSYSTLRMAITF